MDALGNIIAASVWVSLTRKSSRHRLATPEGCAATILAPLLLLVVNARVVPGVGSIGTSDYVSSILQYTHA